MGGDVSPRAIFGRPRGSVVMMPKAPANHAASLTSDAPSDKTRVPYLGVYVRQPFCLFGHVTPHGTIRDALDTYTSLTSPVTLQKLIVASAPKLLILKHECFSQWIRSLQLLTSFSQQCVVWGCIHLYTYIYIMGGGCTIDNINSKFIIMFRKFRKM